jgi:hypothetical protein
MGMKVQALNPLPQHRSCNTNATAVRDPAYHLWGRLKPTKCKKKGAAIRKSIVCSAYKRRKETSVNYQRYSMAFYKMLCFRETHIKKN